MKKRILVLIVSLLVTLSSSAGLSLSAKYSESTQVFEIVDQMSVWHDKSYASYYRYFEQTLKLSSEEREMLAQYVELRKKYKIKRNEQNKKLIFSIPTVNYDIISHSFYSSNNVDQALKKLSKTLKKEELQFLAKFYIALKPKLSVLVKESLMFKSKIKNISEMIRKEKMKYAFNRAYKFFNLPKHVKGKFTVQYVWAPPELGVKIDIVGQHVLIRKNPVIIESGPDSTTLMTKLVLALSALQTKSQQMNLTTQFFSVCVPPNKTSLFNLVEQPLALALGVMSLQAKKMRRKFDPFQKWSDDSWVNLYAKVLFPLVEIALKSKENINGKFIPSAAKLCRDISNVAKHY